MTDEPRKSAVGTRPDVVFVPPRLADGPLLYRTTEPFWPLLVDPADPVDVAPRPLVLDPELRSTYRTLLPLLVRDVDVRVGEVRVGTGSEYGRVVELLEVDVRPLEENERTERELLERELLGRDVLARELLGRETERDGAERGAELRVGREALRDGAERLWPPRLRLRWAWA